jgi:NAD-dependent DNA ligase
MKIVFTGPCHLFTREEFKELLDKNSFIVQSAVSKNTDLLITNDLNSCTTKLKKAQKLNIKIMLYKEFLYEYIPEYLI